MPRASNWSRKLSHQIALKNGATLLTLADAGRYVAKIKGPRARMNRWQSAAGKLLSAAQGGDVEEATKQMVFALLMENRLRL